jgi:hypothetical protein
VPKQPAGRHRYLAHVQLKGATVAAAGNEVTLAGDSSVAAGASGDKVPHDASFTIGLTAVMRCSLLRLPYEKAAAGKKAGKAAGEPSQALATLTLTAASAGVGPPPPPPPPRNHPHHPRAAPHHQCPRCPRPARRPVPTPFTRARGPRAITPSSQSRRCTIIITIIASSHQRLIASSPHRISAPLLASSPAAAPARAAAELAEQLAGLIARC